MRRHAAVFARICTWVCAGCLSFACERDQTPLGRGGRIFQRTCSTCHGPDGRGIQRLGLIKPPRDLTKPEFHAQFTDQQLREVIRYGKGQMPAFGGLMADEDIGHVITFIRSLAPRPEPAPGSAGGGASSASPPAAPLTAPSSEPAGTSGATDAPVTAAREASSR
jgi:mono/diheme cytochrome c family protein